MTVRGTQSTSAAQQVSFERSRNDDPAVSGEASGTRDSRIVEPAGNGGSDTRDSRIVEPSNTLTQLARMPRPNTSDVPVGDNVYNLAENTFNGRRLELRGNDPRDYANIERVVVHETTNGNLTHDDITQWRNDSTPSSERDDIVVNSDAVILQDGTTLQGSVGNRRENEYFGVAGGIGTVTENKTRGSNFDIEIDYNAVRENYPIIPIQRNGVTPVNDAQYRASAKAIADVAVLKYTGEVRSGANRDPNDYGAVITVEPHYFADRGVEDAHTDPRSFDQAKLQRYVNDELRAFGVPTSLVQFSGW